MRVALITEGYPYLVGGVSTWCDQIVRGLTEVAWHVVTIVGDGPATPAFVLPPQVASLTPVPTKSRRRTAVRRRLARPAQGAAHDDAVVRLCRGMLGDSAGALAVFADALRELATESGAPAGAPLPEILLDSWSAATRLLGQRLPRLTARDAQTAAVLLEQALRPLSATVAPVDLCHAAGGGLPALVALAAKWRGGAPFVLTEHRVQLRERYLDSAGHTPAVRLLLLRLHRALARLAYAEADLIAPVTAFNRRWEVRLGADPGRIAVIPNGVDPQSYPPLPAEPATPTIVWVGRVDPVKDLHTLIRALGLVRAQVPDARLHLAGPVPAGGEAYARSCRALVGALGLESAVTFAGPVASSREVFAVGQVVALSSVSEGMPFAVVEAMLSGRPVVGTDTGGVAELVADTGLVVPPRDPAVFAAACVALLSDAGLRRRLAGQARTRALAHYPLYRCLETYRRQYARLTDRCAA